MFPFALLHGGMVDPNAPWWQKAIDAESGNNVGVFLHTIGASFFIGGAIVLMLWAWANRRGPVDPARYHVVATQWIVLAGMGMNGLGGLMRLLQSDHPTLPDLDTNPWVQYIFVKHLFLVAGNALALGLMVWYVPRRHRVLWWPPAGLWPRRREPEPDGGSADLGGRRARLAAGAAAFIVLSSLLAGVLGAAANTVGPGVEEEPMTGTLQLAETPQSPALVFANFSGPVTATPAAPFAATHPFPVPFGTVQIRATVTWTAPTTAMTVALADADGAGVTTATSAPGSTSVVAVADEGFRNETWSVRLSSQRGAGDTYNVEVRILVAREPVLTLSGRAVIPAGGFAEINLHMDAGDTLEWQWETEGAMLAFDIHWHRDGVTVFEERVNETEAQGVYEAARTDVHSPMWTNPGDGPAVVAFILKGPVRIHSTVGV